MSTIKEDALQAISSLPKTASVEDIMYRLYVLEKIRKGQSAVLKGETLSLDALKKDMATW
ncbi:MAG: hypothetical protein AB7F28_05185 [Candidatus Margulisiibacteriota bacterium]